MGGGALALEEADLGQQQGAGADRGDLPGFAGSGRVPKPPGTTSTSMAGASVKS
jgi:hypothetical protein